MTTHGRAERRYEWLVMGVALVAVLFRTSQWRLGAPDVGAVAIIALLLVPLAVRTQVTISRGQVDLTLGASVVALFSADVTSQSSILPIWAVLVAGSYATFHRDETWGQFRAAIQILGGAALLRVAEITDIGYRPYDRVFAGLATYFLVITALEVLRRVVAPPSQDGWMLRLRWAWTFLVGLGVFYLGCLVAALRWLEEGADLPLVPSLVVLLVGLVAMAVGLGMRNRSLSRSVAALTGAAVAMPWRREEIDGVLGRWAARGLRVQEVVVRDRPGDRWDLSAPLSDGRYAVAERSPGDLPFNQVETNVLEALAHMSNTSRREAEQADALRERANTDGLTGLSTYTYFRDVLNGVSSDRHEGESIAIVFIDLDGFKEINDRYGHLTGDEAIRALAQRLNQHVGDARFVTRYGGDEFAVLVRGVRDYAALTEECERLRVLVTEPITIGQDTLRLRASIGSALSSSPDDDVEQIVRAADQQMYQRKRAVHADDGPIATRIDEAVRSAIVTGTLSSAYQPVVSIKDGQVWGLEALVRHTDPELGSIPPPVIVESAIRLNMLDDLTLMVFDQAVATMLECRAYVPKLTLFSINVELEQILTWTPLLDRIARCAAEHDLRVGLELSEHSIGDWSDAHAQISRKLRSAGVLIGIDDFGAGHAGLSSLYLDQIDVVKLDRSLLKDLRNPRQELVLTRTIGLLVELGLWSVVEGVSEEFEVDIMRTAGATHLQGYRYGMPLSREETVARFRRSGLTPIVDPEIQQV